MKALKSIGVFISILFLGVILGSIFPVVGHDSLLYNQIEYIEIPVDYEENDSNTHDSVKIDLVKLGRRLLETEFKTKDETDLVGKLYIVDDPIVELKDYEDSCKSTEGAVMSAISGTYGTFIVNEETELAVTILKDNTEVNGFYVGGFNNNKSSDTSVYKYNDIFVVFETFISEERENEIILNINEADEIKQKVFDIIINYINT